MNVTSLVFFGCLAWFAVPSLLNAWRIQEYSPGVLSIPMVIPRGGLALGALLLIIVLVVSLVESVQQFILFDPIREGTKTYPESLNV